MGIHFSNPIFIFLYPKSNALLRFEVLDGVLDNFAVHHFGFLHQANQQAAVTHIVYSQGYSP
jgi:hypothetical protein